MDSEVPSNPNRPLILWCLVIFAALTHLRGGVPPCNSSRDGSQAGRLREALGTGLSLGSSGELPTAPLLLDTLPQPSHQAGPSEKGTPGCCPQAALPSPPAAKMASKRFNFSSLTRQGSVSFSSRGCLQALPISARIAPRPAVRELYQVPQAEGFWQLSIQPGGKTETRRKKKQS